MECMIEALVRLRKAVSRNVIVWTLRSQNKANNTLSTLLLRIKHVTLIILVVIEPSAIEYHSLLIEIHSPEASILVVMS